ncbi:MAG TPA: Fic family protein [Longimicrobium sp.]|nr:Fic family protein [Longimicrobium sp.]
MRSFDPGFLRNTQITHGLLRTLTAIAERKGRIQLFRDHAPQVLETLRHAAVIESTESSNRIEGITAAPERLRALVAESTAPRDRPEQEIAGYRDVLATIHANHPYISRTPNVVLQLHRDLYHFTTLPGGRWKSVDNSITEVQPDGTRIVRFEPVPAYQTAGAMRDLHQRFEEEWERGEVEPLILIAAYVLDFLCIHPFLDGNGRMARLLTLLLLYHAGHDVGRYVSLERLVEQTKESYHEALRASSRGWHEGTHTLRPWLEYLLGVVVFGAYSEIDARVGAVTSGRGAKRELVRDAVQRLPTTFRYVDVERACPGVSRPTINRALRELREEGIIRCTRPGRDATWEKS